jgi:2-hydroxychromene-2-carboxylate isomerase
MTTIELYFEYARPWAYLANELMRDIARCAEH